MHMKDRLQRFESFVPKNLENRDKEAIQKGVFPFNHNERYTMNDGVEYSAILIYEGNKGWATKFHARTVLPDGQARILSIKIDFDIDWSSKKPICKDIRSVEASFVDWPKKLKFKDEEELKKFSVRATRECLHDLGATYSANILQFDSVEGKLGIHDKLITLIFDAFKSKKLV